MNRLDIKKRGQILHALVEGVSLRAASRIADVSRNTVDKLLWDVGVACLAYQNEHLRNLSCKRLECDEIWNFAYSKQKNIPKGMDDNAGDVWIWTAICAESKVVPCWHVGSRNAKAANAFLLDLAGRMKHRVRLATNGCKTYLNAVEDAFVWEIDYALLIKMYGGEDKKHPEKKYNPESFKDARKRSVNGSHDMDSISTSCIDRQNQAMRIGMRQSTRLTNGLSKKMENQMHAISLHYMYYNFCRIHQSLSVTPCMEAGVSDHVWSLEEIAALADSH